MDESACLLRSFSDTTDTSSLTSKEFDPIRLLGESISFGRYMSESLNWEKYSAFSQKRYVEEAEKSSKPGSVAEMKAYFEAHYKKKAAQKASVLAQEANSSVNETLDYETQHGYCNDLSIEINSEEHSNVTVVEEPEKDAVDCQAVDYAHTNKDKCGIEQIEVEISKVGTAEDVPQPLVDTNLTVESSVLVDDSNQREHVEKTVIPIEERMPDPGNLRQVKRGELNSSPTLSTIATTSKPSYPLVEKKATVPRSGISGAPKREKPPGGLAAKKKLSAWSLHMSINLTSCAGETRKPASVLQQNNIKRISSNLPNKSRDQPIASQTSTRASCAVFNQASESHQSKGRRCPKSLITSIPRSSTISSPFRFRSEERVAKRKEFFEKIHETKSKEAERVQLQRICKEKSGHDDKLQQRNGFKPKPNEDRNGGSQLSSNKMGKTSLSQPQSPKTGRKATSSSSSHGKIPQNSWKPPVSVNTSKRITEKISQTSRQSVSSLSKKIRQENVAPNIQR